MSDKFETKEGTFSLIKVYPENKRKETSPDFFGEAKFKGVELRLSAWARLTDTGKIRITGYIEEKQVQDHEKPTESQLNDFLLTPEMKAAQTPPPPSGPGPLETPEDDLPF